MRKIKIYQIQFMRSDYVFMGWEYAKDKFNIDDYKLVAEYEEQDYKDDFILNEVWNKGNNGELQCKFPNMYSVSVSNIIEIDDKKYYVDSFGFKEID